MNAMELTCNSSTNYSYKLWFDTMTSFSPDVKRYRLEEGGSYFFDPQAVVDFDAKAKKASGAEDRVWHKLHREITSNGGGVCRIELFIDALNVHKYYLSDNKTRLHREFVADSVI